MEFLETRRVSRPKTYENVCFAGAVHGAQKYDISGHRASRSKTYENANDNAVNTHRVPYFTVFGVTALTV